MKTTARLGGQRVRLDVGELTKTLVRRADALRAGATCSAPTCQPQDGFVCANHSGATVQAQAERTAPDSARREGVAITDELHPLRPFSNALVEQCAQIADGHAALWERQIAAIEAEPDETFSEGARTKGAILASHAHVAQSCYEIAAEIRALAASRGAEPVRATNPTFAEAWTAHTLEALERVGERPSVPEPFQREALNERDYDAGSIGEPEEQP